MKKIKTKNLTKQIICIIIILMLCNFIFPTCSMAVDTDSGGSAIGMLGEFLCFIPDAVIEFLQDMFVSPEAIEKSNGAFEILYSPGTIFSGQIPAFDLNFINPGEDKTGMATVNRYVSLIDALNMNGGRPIKEETYSSIDESSTVLTDLKASVQAEAEEIDRISLGGKLESSNTTETIIDVGGKFADETITQRLTYAFYNTDKTKIYVIVDYITKTVSNTSTGSNGSNYPPNQPNNASTSESYKYKYILYEISSIDKLKEVTKITGTYSDIATETKVYKSSAGILQNIIATWYNVFRRIALVGLLSVIVYVGIKILLSSTSAKDKAKYKNMLKDWFIALCLLFVLHYIMTITITIVNNVNEVIKVSSIGANGQDILMSSVRNRIAREDDWAEALTYVVIYDVLAVFTVIYTIQYIRRVIHLGFLTAIAPLITLTYPLDKIKDGKAQAFDMWLKDYIFYSLIQVVHLLLYYIFLGTAIDLNKEGNWLFAIVAIGFLVPAEKIVKKMFGFEKSKSLGAMEAGATGALVSNVMNNISKNVKKGGSGGGTGSGTGVTSSVETTNNKIRTTSFNPLAALQGMDFVTGGAGGTTSDETSGGTGRETGTAGSGSTGGRTGSGTSGSGTSGSGTSGSGTSGSGTSGSGTSGSGTSGSRTSGSRTSGSRTSGRTGEKRSIKNGVKSVAKKYFLPTTKTLLGLGGAGAGAMLGFAGGVAQGDIGKAFAGLAAGGAAGRKIAHGGVEFVSNIPGNIKKTVEELQDTWNEGALGEEQAQRIKFKRTSDYKELKENNPNFSDEKLEEIFDAGITDKNRIGKILKNNQYDPSKYSMEEAIRFSKMAKECPDAYLHNPVKFIKYCRSKNIQLEEEELEDLRKNIIRFK